MKFSEKWLREYVDPPKTTQELGAQLTQAGLEVESIEPVASSFNEVVVGLVLSVEKHPDAEKLSVCRVDVGQETPLQIVCGAKNVAPQMKVPTALIGAQVGTLKIQKTKLRGIESCGMLCSAKELGLADTSEGILPLPSEAPVGESVSAYLKLDDMSIELELTPNRGDCLSLLGIAREVALLNEMDFSFPSILKHSPTLEEKKKIHLEAKKPCPFYSARILRGVNLNKSSPLWLQEKLRRSGIRSIDPVVDVTQYVMLELGQPLHAFDLDCLQGDVSVRFAKPGESLTLLDERDIKLRKEDLVIADDKGPLALAGIMGGHHSGVTEKTKNILLESAYFSPESLALSARHFGLYTESSRRFERSVDFKLQEKALERATELLLELFPEASVGPVMVVEAQEEMPESPTFLVRHSRIERVLGYEISKEKITNIFHRLGMKVVNEEEGWRVTPPSYRRDISAEIDAVEEVGRVLGYDSIPYGKSQLLSPALHMLERKISQKEIQHLLLDREYFEIITYSFVDPQLQETLFPSVQALALKNPIAQTLSAMRVSLWPGLLQAALYNLNRQQSRLRFFEYGLCFRKEGEEVIQVPQWGGFITGDCYGEQWSEKKRPVDFYDIKSDVEALLQLTRRPLWHYEFKPTTHPALHPGVGADIFYKGKQVGSLGALHPAMGRALDFPGSCFLFELDAQLFEDAELLKFATLSKYPLIRRDLALLVPDSLPAARILEVIREETVDWLLDLFLFDVYRGASIGEGQKSIGVGLLLQHPERTLKDEEINHCMNKVRSILQEKTGAILREF